jgi:feruloyl esterase
MLKRSEFAPNPGNLGMFEFVPAGLPASAALVVALHGGQQTAQDFDKTAGWSELADQNAFAVLYPEQKGDNNFQNCFNWFVEQDIGPAGGEVASICTMIETMIARHGIDPRRIFVTGLSAGGAMACALLAACPGLFSGGAIIAGLPYRAALGTFDAFMAMAFAPVRSSREWGNLIRRVSPDQKTWPKISVWHGSRDDIVAPANSSAMVRQWIDLHQVDEAAVTQEEVDGQIKLSWLDASGLAVVEHYEIEGMAHGIPVNAKLNGLHQKRDPFAQDAGISSTFHIANSWGLLKAGEFQEPLVVSRR